MNKLKFLIVDDEIYSRKMLKMLLEKEGYEVLAEAEDGSDAFKKYKKHRPDLVFMDIVMPGRGGIAAVKKIIEYDPDAKIIMLSAVGQKRIILEALEAGAINYASKPIRAADIIEVINKTKEFLYEEEF